MDMTLYRRYQREYIQQAMKMSDGTNRSISEALWGMTAGSGLFSRHKVERARALEDVRRAFDEHRHWPTDMVLNNLGLDPKELGS